MRRFGKGLVRVALDGSCGWWLAACTKRVRGYAGPCADATCVGEPCGGAGACQRACRAEHAAALLTWHAAPGGAGGSTCSCGNPARMSRLPWCAKTVLNAVPRAELPSPCSPSCHAARAARLRLLAWAALAAAEPRRAARPAWPV